MIVHAIEETLDKGLQREGQIVPMSESSLSGLLNIADLFSVPTFVFGVRLLHFMKIALTIVVAHR
jgi:hypothetical protein